MNDMPPSRENQSHDLRVGEYEQNRFGSDGLWTRALAMRPDGLLLRSSIWLVYTGGDEKWVLVIWPESGSRGGGGGGGRRKIRCPSYRNGALGPDGGDGRRWSCGSAGPVGGLDGCLLRLDITHGMMSASRVLREGIKQPRGGGHWCKPQSINGTSTWRGSFPEGGSRRDPG
jgi:hypothetical protein